MITILKEGDSTEIYPPGRYEIKYQYKDSSTWYKTEIITDDNYSIRDISAQLSPAFAGFGYITKIIPIGDVEDAWTFEEYLKVLERKKKEIQLKKSKRIFK